MWFLLQGVDVNVVASNDFGHGSYNAALIFHSEAQIPADGLGVVVDLKVVRIQESRDLLGTYLLRRQSPLRFR
jgi:hypothetical protein